jgi:hypothetical protein
MERGRGRSAGGVTANGEPTVRAGEKPGRGWDSRAIRLQATEFTACQYSLMQKIPLSNPKRLQRLINLV